MPHFKSVNVWGFLVVLLSTICMDVSAAKVTRLAGSVAVRSESATSFQSLENAMVLNTGGHVKTAVDGLARIQYDDNTEVTVRPNSEVVIGGIGNDDDEDLFGINRVESYLVLYLWPKAGEIVDLTEAGQGQFSITSNSLKFKLSSGATFNGNCKPKK